MSEGKKIKVNSSESDFDKLLQEDDVAKVLAERFGRKEQTAPAEDKSAEKPQPAPEKPAEKAAPKGEEKPAPADSCDKVSVPDQQEQILRLHAELENFKKRTEREMAAFRKYAQENLIKAILPQIDNLERALEHGAKENPEDPLVTGVEMTLKGLKDALEKFGLSRIDACGNPFDPSLHEAVMQQEDAEAEDNTVLMETQAGYTLNDRLLRPAMVIVSKRPADAEACD